MKLRHVGYACINLTLETASRTVRLANLRTESVIPVVSQNLDDILRMLKWNVAHGIRFLRISSDLVPFATFDTFPFDWAEAFRWKLDEIRRFVKTENVRVSSHPGQYTVLNSLRDEVVRESVKELEHQSRVLDLIDPRGGTMTLHVGGAFNDKPTSLARFAANLPLLSEGARKKLVIENDDKTFTLEEVVGLAEQTGLGVVVDFFHHKCNPSGATWDEGFLPLLERAMATWGKRVPKLHLSSQGASRPTAHADYLEQEDLDVLVDVMAQVGRPDQPYDLMLEAKKKELAALEVLGYLETGAWPARADGTPAPIALEPEEATP